MSKVRIGIIGIGGMGSAHAQSIVNGAVEDAELTAVCDINPDRLKWAKEVLGEGVQTFSNADEFFAAKPSDAIIIATPHYFHPPLAIQGFANGFHVLCEKPAGVYTKQVREMNEAAEKSGKMFSMMFNQRTNPFYQKVKELISAGELGELKRVNWIITDWYRTQSYYNSGGWRATWSGEGGGVLVNQSPHQLDLLQWMCGMPKRVRAFCGFGKYHEIEVEDEVTAYLEYENGASGVFITSTGEAPGTNRLEIAGDKGKIVVENWQLSFWRLCASTKQFTHEAKGGFDQPECWKCEVPIWNKETGHVGILNNWVGAIANGSPLLASGTEGIQGVQLANAMHPSSWLENWVEIPVDEDLYFKKLQEKINASTFVKKDVESVTMDVSGTFGSR